MKKVLIVFLLGTLTSCLGQNSSDKLVSQRSQDSSLSESNDYLIKKRDGIIDTLQGTWKMQDAKNDFLILNDDSVFLKDDNGYYDKFTVKITDIIQHDGVFDTAKDNEHFFLEIRSDDTNVFYLLGYDKNEFSLMSRNNGQTVVYKRLK